MKIRTDPTRIHHRKLVDDRSFNRAEREIASASNELTVYTNLAVRYYKTHRFARYSQRFKLQDHDIQSINCTVKEFSWQKTSDRVQELLTCIYAPIPPLIPALVVEVETQKQTEEQSRPRDYVICAPAEAPTDLHKPWISST